MGWELVQDGEKTKCWIDLDEIEIYTEGVNKGRRNWKNSVGKKIGARYKWINDEVDEKWFIIKDYYINNYLILVDKNNNEFKIKSNSLCRGELGKMFDKFTDKFIYNIGSEINGLKIIDREYRKNKNGQNCKYYQYQCLKCGNIDWVIESDLKRNRKCNVCLNRKIIKGVNDIATTNPELIKYFVNQEDVYKYPTGSDEKVLLKCPDCGHQKEMTINTLHRYGFGCNKCSDGTSYPEKFMVNILSQLNINFITQLNHTTFNWCQNFRYDFYLLDYNIIIETHGRQHYEGNGFKTYEEVHENDLLKYKLAVLNGFEANKNYFVIDSRESTLEWMKENIIKTLCHLFDFSNVDWEKADLESQKSHMILACQLKKENPDLVTKEIIELIKKEIGIEYSDVTILKWLNRGNKLGLCYYNGKEEKSKNGKRLSEYNKGKHHSEETRAKISEAHKGIHHSEETRAKISEAVKGEKHPLYGKNRSEETRAKQSEAMKGMFVGEKNPRARKVVSLDPLTKQPIFIWQYKQQATEFYGINRKKLDCYLKGNAKTGHEYNGFLWYYLDEYEQLTK